MRPLLKLIFLFFVSPWEWRDMAGFFMTKETKARRSRSIQGGYLADIDNDDPFR